MIRRFRRLGARAWKHRKRIALALGALVAAPFVLVLVLALVTPLPPELREAPSPSLRVLAKDGTTLREVRTDDGARARPLPLVSFPPHVRRAVLAAEDRRFYAHVGVDPVAVTRAIASDVTHLRIVSGASTITMQLARTLRPHPRSMWGKITEAALAIRIEASLSKDQILEEYLNRVTYGPNLRGYAAASQAYLGKTPDELSTAEGALIAGLPRGPSLYDVTRRPALAKKRRDRVLARMNDAGMIDDGARERAIAEAMPKKLDAPSFGAPHFVHALAAGTLGHVQPSLGGALDDRRALSSIETTLDPELQRAAERAITTTLASLTGKHVGAAAVVAIDNATGDVLAYVGSPDFFAAEGQNDGVRALRQPGSALKPFVYAEAMTRLGYTGATLLPDVELHIPLPAGGDYVPHDYDGRLRGPVRLRDALGNSLNVPAVYTLREVGTARVLERLHAFGFASLTEDAEHYGPALALGDGEVTLLELANAYATLARGGMMRPLRVVRSITRAGVASDFAVADETRAVDEKIAAILTDILADKSARLAAFGDQNVLELDFEVAAKTGTSKGYRDNVAVGYTREITVAAWAGNFDGSPMQEVSGIAGAGPVFHAVMEAAVSTRAQRDRARAPLAIGSSRERFGLVRTAVCALSGEIATAACPHKVFEWLPDGDADHAPSCTHHERVTIDVRNGLRAGPACDRATIEERVFESWPAPFDGWARAMERPLAPLASSPSCPIMNDAVASTKRPRIAYPFDGARFVIDPERPIALQKLDIAVEPFSSPVDLRIDGELVSPAWPLEAGTHTIVAESAGSSSVPVRISVR